MSCLFFLRYINLWPLSMLNPGSCRVNQPSVLRCTEVGYNFSISVSVASATQENLISK